jgi:hypothetical protein
MCISVQTVADQRGNKGLPGPNGTYQDLMGVNGTYGSHGTDAARPNGGKPRKVGENRGKWRKVAEGGGKWR